MGGTAQTLILAFSLLCLLSKVRPSPAPQPRNVLLASWVWWGRGESLQASCAGLSPASLPGAQTAVSGQLCCVTSDPSLPLSEPQLPRQLRG